MPQTSVSLDYDKAIKGMYAVDRPHDTFTGVNQEANDVLNFGDPVFISSYDDYDPHVREMDNSAACVRCDGFVAYDSREGGIIKNKESVAVVRKGLIWVVAGIFSGAVSAGSTVVWDLSAQKFVANTLQYDLSETSFDISVTPAAGDIVIGGIRVWSALTAAEVTAGTKLALLEVNLPGAQFITIA